MGQGFFVIEELVAGLTVRFVHLMGAIYARARYLGPVDLGVAVTNLRGAVSVMAQHNVVGYDFPPFDQPEYRRTARFSAEELALNPQLVAKQLVMPLSRRLHRTAKILSQEHECIEPALAPLA
jgi:hypothetical protein